jgi:hypothetical protein
MDRCLTLNRYLYTAYAPTPANRSPKKITHRKLQPTGAEEASLPAHRSENRIRQVRPNASEMRNGEQKTNSDNDKTISVQVGLQIPLTNL